MPYTVPGGFSGGIITGATTFDSTVTFRDSILLPGSVDENDILTINAGDNTADRTLTLLATGDITFTGDAGSMVFDVPNVANKGLFFQVGSTSRAGVINDGTNHSLALAAATHLNWGATTVGSAPDTGLARSAAGVVKITDGSSGDGVLRVAQGSNTAVALGSDDAAGETGWYFAGDSMIASINTGKVFAIGAGNGNDFRMNSTVPFGWASGDAVSTTADTGLARSAAGLVKVTDGSTGDGGIAVRDGNGTSTFGLVFDDDADTGIYRVTTNDIGFVAGGVIGARVRDVGGSVTSLHAQSILTIGNTSDTALNRVAAGVVGFTTVAGGDSQISLETAGHRIAANQVTLTEAGGAETVCTITTATTQTTGGRFYYTVRASDVTPDYAVRSGVINFAIINNATVVTASLGGVTNETNDGSTLLSTNSKTLTYAIAADVATANTFKITFNIDSDMTVTAASITWTCILNGPGTVA